MDEALRRLATGMFNALYILSGTRQLYSLNKESVEGWPEMTKYNVEEGALSLMFQEILSCN